MDLALEILALVVALIGLLWFFVPIFSGIPWVPTDEERVRAALRLADLCPGELLYDLGSGDGRVLLVAGRDFGARSLGIEVSPLHCLLAQGRIRRARLGRQAAIRWGSYYRSDLRPADVVYFYGHSKYVKKLKGYLAANLHEGARLVSIGVDFPGWQPEKVDKDKLIFVYRMLPSAGDVTSYLMQEALLG